MIVSRLIDGLGTTATFTLKKSFFPRVNLGIYRLLNSAVQILNGFNYEHIIVKQISTCYAPKIIPSVSLDPAKICFS